MNLRLSKCVSAVQGILRSILHQISDFDIVHGLNHQVRVRTKESEIAITVQATAKPLQGSNRPILAWRRIAHEWRKEENLGWAGTESY